MRLPIWLFLALLHLVSTSPVASAQASSVVIALAPGASQPAKIPLNLAPDATTTSAILYLSAAEPMTASVRLSAQLVDEQNIRRNEIGVTFTARIPGEGGTTTAVDAMTTAISLPADGSDVRVDLSVANVNANGVFSGTIIAQVNGGFSPGPELVITHLPKPSLAFTGAGDDGFSIDEQLSSDFNSTFFIESLNRTPTKLAVLVSPFIGPDGAPVTPSWTVNGGAAGPEIEVQGLATATVSVSAALPQIGVYKSGLTLVYDNERHTTKLNVTRKRVAPPVEVQEIQTVKGELGVGSLNGAQVRFDLVPTSGKTITLELPSFTLNLIGASASQTQGSYDGVLVKDAHDKPMTNPLILSSVPIPVHLDVLNIREPGEYEGTIQITGKDFQPLEKKVKILMRENVWVAGFFILLGILISAIIRVLVKLVRPRLAAQLKLRLVLDDLQAQAELLKDNLNEAEKKVLNGLARQLERHYDLAVNGQDQNTDALITKLRELLPLLNEWVNLRLRVEALQPPSLRDAFLRRLQDIGKQFLEVAPDQVNELKSIIAQLGPDIDKALKDEMKKQIDALNAELQRFVAPDEGTPAFLLYQRIQNELNTASEELEQKHFEQASNAYQNARRAYIELLIADLDTKLTAAEPTGFDKAAWEALGTSVRGKLVNVTARLKDDPEQAGLLFDAAYKEYLDAVVDKLRGRALEEKQKLDKTKPVAGSPNELTWQKLSDQVDNVLKTLGSAQQGLQALKPDLATISREYDEARVTLEAVLKQLTPAGGVLGVGGSSVVTRLAQALGGGAPPTAAGEKAPATLEGILLKVPDTGWLTKTILLNEAILSLVVFAVAIVFGLKLLWIDVPTWGGWGAYVAAFLWGLGLQQVAGQGFEGWTGLRTQLESK